MREDFKLYNDAGSWSIVACDALSSIIEDVRSNDGRFVRDHVAMLIGISGDDYATVRAVVNEPLTEAERAEAVARLSWRLNVGDKGVLVSGGFDPDTFADWADQGESGYVRALAIPAGDYRVSFFSYIHSMDGAVWSSPYPGSGQKLPPVLEWFLKDHPAKPLPAWLVAAKSLDDGQKFKDRVAAGEFVAEDHPRSYIGYLFHLEPFEADMELSAPPADGWFESSQGIQVPARCPVGIRSAGE